MIDLAGSLEASHRQYAEGTVKTAEDLARYRVVIERTRPRRIVEIGSYSGKSALWFARTAGCPVVSVDVDHSHIAEETFDRGRMLGVTYLRGRSDDRRIVAMINAWMVSGPNLVTLDGDHSASTVLAELDLYAPMVAEGCYVVVEDGIVAHMPDQMRPIGPYDGNPLEAITRWLPTHPEWVSDLTIEDLYPTTQFPAGWLLRSSEAQ